MRRSVAVLAVAAWTVPYSASTAAATELTASEAQAQVIVVTSDFESRSVALGIGKSVVLDFPRDIKDVLVADPKIANAVIRSSRRAYIIGNEVGQTNVFFFDAEGRQMAGLDIAVTRNLNGIRAAIRQLFAGRRHPRRRHRRRRHSERHGFQPSRGAAGFRPRRQVDRR